MSPAAKRLLFWVPMALALAVALAWLFRPAAVPVDLVKVERGPLMASVSDEGETRVRDMYVVSAPVPGRMRRIDLEVGDTVVAGQTVIARIEPSDPAKCRASGLPSQRVQLAIGRSRTDRISRRPRNPATRPSATRPWLQGRNASARCNAGCVRPGYGD
mgnify:CR=1 FL=1